MNYLEKAEYFGQDVEALRRGERVTSQITLNSIDDYKLVFTHGITAEQQAQWSASFEKRPTYAHEDQKRNAFFKHVYGGAELNSEASAYAEEVFPMTMTMDSATEYIVDENQEAIGPAGSPYGINASTVIFDGGVFTVETTSFTLQAENLILNQNDGNDQYHVYILGTDGQTGQKGANGDDGTDGKDGKDDGVKNNKCDCDNNGTRGDDGTPGGDGSPGEDGPQGEANFVATFIINGFDESNNIPFSLYTRSGAGGNGGTGGDGGDGGDGGKGGDGCSTTWDKSCGKNGGDAGDGGNGGDGGAGAQGTDGIDSIITFPYDGMLSTQGEKSKGGIGGDGGNGGTAGERGKGGNGKNGKDDGDKGSYGSDGKAGGPGKDGAEAEVAGSFVS